MIKNLKSYFLLMILPAVVTGCVMVQTNIELEARLPEIQTVAIMPPDFLVEEVTYNEGSETLYEESREAARKAREALEQSFKKKGYGVKQFELTEELTREDPELEQELSRLKTKYETFLTMQTRVDMGKAGIGQDAPTFGSDVNRIADLTGADVLIFSYGRGYVSSGGVKGSNFAKQILVGAVTGFVPTYHEKGGHLFVSVVDGDNGNELWRNSNVVDDGLDFRSGWLFKQTIRNVANHFPKRKK